MKKLSYLNYFAASGLITVILLVMYAGIQQTYRTGLDDPQIQLARDISLKLEQGRSLENLNVADPIDISKSLSPFIVIYDASGKPMYSNALLDGKMPQLPVGLFDIAKNKEEHKVTWQPRSGVRMAMVIRKVHTSPLQFVAAGRSMTAVEERTAAMRTMIFFAWIICIGIIVLAVALNHFMVTKKIN